MSSLMEKSLKLILNHEPIIVPTDTVYGLVCRYDSRYAVEKIYKLKKRSRRKPLILLGYNWKALKRFVITDKNRNSKLETLKLSWPGPLTIVLPASSRLPKFLNKGFKTIGIRVPSNKNLLNLLKRCPKKVLASTSANISGKKDVKSIAKKVKLFVKAKRGEMSFKPSRIIEVSKLGCKVIR